MPDDKLEPSNALLRQKALSRWETEGGAGPDGPQTSSMQADIPHERDRRSVVNRVRGVLENLIISLLAEASDRQLGLVREMASYISPTQGFTHHPLTIHAAVHMNNLVDRARHFQDRTPA